jgi:hypothetical protein
LIKGQASTVERATIAALVRMVGQHSTANLPDYASLTKLNNMTGSTGAAGVACGDYGYNGRRILTPTMRLTTFFEQSPISAIM